MAGGCDGWCVENPALASAESWDPDTGEWTPVADMPTPLSSANVSLDRAESLLKVELQIAELSSVIYADFECQLNSNELL